MEVNIPLSKGTLLDWKPTGPDGGRKMLFLKIPRSYLARCAAFSCDFPRQIQGISQGTVQWVSQPQLKHMTKY